MRTVPEELFLKREVRVGKEDHSLLMMELTISSISHIRSNNDPKTYLSALFPK